MIYVGLESSRQVSAFALHFQQPQLNNVFQCTKERPTCAPCLQLNLQCNYSRKVSRTPLTRSNLTAAEDRVRDLETALTSLFPGIDLDTVLSSIHSENSATSSSRSTTRSAKKPLLDEEGSRNANSASESLPRDADGFDWTETAVRLSELSDGMAALSINPEGAGYLGKCPKRSYTI